MVQNNIQTRMAEKYGHYKNTIAERVNGILKQEFNINQKVNDLNIKTKLIRDTIEVYNHIRPHVPNHILTNK
nr:integrase core domain-containing protein [uncultured Maribacter sp.]